MRFAGAKYKFRKDIQGVPHAGDKLPRARYALFLSAPNQKMSRNISAAFLFTVLQTDKLQDSADSGIGISSRFTFHN